MIIVLEVVVVIQESQEKFPNRLIIVRMIWFEFFVDVNRVDIIDFLKRGQRFSQIKCR